MKKWMEQFRVEDWVVVWVSIPLLALAAVAPSALPKVPATLLGGVRGAISPVSSPSCWWCSMPGA